MNYLTNLFLYIVLYTLKAIKYLFAFIIYTQLIIKYITLEIKEKNNR